MKPRKWGLFGSSGVGGATGFELKPEVFFLPRFGRKIIGTHRETDTTDINMNIYIYIYNIISVYLCISNSYFSWILVLDIVGGDFNFSILWVGFSNLSQ